VHALLIAGDSLYHKPNPDLEKAQAALATWGGMAAIAGTAVLAEGTAAVAAPEIAGWFGATVAAPRVVAVGATALFPVVIAGSFAAIGMCIYITCLCGGIRPCLPIRRKRGARPSVFLPPVSSMDISRCSAGRWTTVSGTNKKCITRL
jgi:hypothetical protein